MSSSSGGNDVVEPNLTPLLDLVMQLLMFFIICVRFVTDQVKQEIQVPDNQEARPASNSADQPIVLNLLGWDGAVKQFFNFVDGRWISKSEADLAELRGVLGDSRYFQAERLYNLFKGDGNQIMLADANFRPGEAMVVTLTEPNPMSLRKWGDKRPNPDRFIDVTTWLRSTYQDLPTDINGKKLERRVRIRADRNVEYQDVYQVAEVCRRNKFTSLYYGVMLPAHR